MRGNRNKDLALIGMDGELEDLERIDSPLENLGGAGRKRERERERTELKSRRSTTGRRVGADLEARSTTCRRLEAMFGFDKNGDKLEGFRAWPPGCAPHQRANPPAPFFGGSELGSTKQTSRGHPLRLTEWTRSSRGNLVLCSNDLFRRNAESQKEKTVNCV